MTIGTIAARRNQGLVWLVFLCLGGVVLGSQVVSGGPMLRVVGALVIVGVLAIPAIDNPRRAILALFVLLPFLGMIRHIILLRAGQTALDPLLLVTSAVAVLIFASMVLQKTMDFGGTAMSAVVFMLLLVGILQVFNPQQASTYPQALLIGVTGVMINLVPISFFFIARTLSDDEMIAKVVRLVTILGAIAAVYGLVQVYVGFRGFEKSWMAENGYGALTVGSTTRPFSIFNNAAEYAAYAHYAFVAGFAWLLFAPKGKRTLMLGLVCVVAYSGFLIGSRGYTVKVALAIALLIAVRARSRMIGMALLITLLGSAILWSASTTSTDKIQEKEPGAPQLIEQQVRALADPFDRHKSTLPVHWDQFREGITFAVTKRPLGLGTGVATRAGAKFGGVSAGTELDIGDSFLSLGILGGMLYIGTIVLGIVQATRTRKLLGGPTWMAAWAMILTSVGAWLNGGLYSVIVLTWFMLGAVDGAYKRARIAQAAEPAAP